MNTPSNLADITKQLHNAIGALVDSLELLRSNDSSELLDAIHTIGQAEKVIVTGLGKSGIVARKMAATLTSVRVPGIFVHPVDALHGDIGVLGQHDVVVAFSKSGETREVLTLFQVLKDTGARLISVTSRSQSSLGGLATHAVVAPFVSEFDPQNILPTSSTTMALVVADMLCVGVAMLKGNLIDSLRQSHPHGAIGSSLARTVQDVMQSVDGVLLYDHDQPLSVAIEMLTSRPLGIVCLVASDNTICGVITDGDIRRATGAGVDVSQALCSYYMTKNPVTVSQRTTLFQALSAMEGEQRQISAVPVINDAGVCVGVLRLHDIAKAQL